MSNPLDKHRFTVKSEELIEHALRITQHFDSQNDLFTQCPNCKKHITGTMATIQAHVCDQVAELIGHAPGS